MESHSPYSDREILLQILDESRRTNAQISKIHERLAVLDSYNIPKAKDDIRTNDSRLTKLEMQIKMWAAGAGFLFMVVGLIIQEVLRNLWPSSH